MDEPNSNDVQEAMKVYAICGKLNIPDSQTRLYSYIHMMLRENDLGMEQFSDPLPEHIAAIGYLIGNVNFKELLISMGNSNCTADEKQEILSDLEKKLQEQRTNLEDNEMEELLNRLKLYGNEGFRTKALNFYNYNIVPEIENLSIEDAEKLLQMQKNRKK